MSIDATAGMNASWATQPRDPASAAAQQVTNAQELRSARGGQDTPAREAVAPASEPRAPEPRSAESRPAPPAGQGRNVDILA